MNFKFIEQQASLDGSLPLYVDMITNKRTIRVNVNNVKDVSPLYVDSLIEGLKLERPDMEHKLELFVYFVKDFDPQAISKPPQKKEIQVLLKWFFENVDSDIDVQHIGGERKNGLVLSWYCSNLERKKQATIPESATLKDLASVVLSTGDLQSFKKPKTINLEGRS